MSNTAAIEQESVEHLDFELECAMPSCRAAAAWWNVCRNCDAAIAYCDGHKVLLIAATRVCRAVGCGKCGLLIDAKLWWLLFKWIPIGGAA